MTWMTCSAPTGPEYHPTDDLNEPFASLVHAVRTRTRSDPLRSTQNPPHGRVNGPTARLGGLLASALAGQSASKAAMVDLTCQHKNQALLVEGPEVMIRPVGTRPQSMRGRFSADQLQTMIDLYKAGATAEQVAQVYGFSTRSIKRLLQQHGVRREHRTNA
jgi:hypothetical protein